MNKLKEIKFKGVSIQSALIIILGSFLIAVGINLFLVPTGLFPTGFTGVSYEVSLLFKNTLGITLNYSLIAFLFNIPILIFGYYKIGTKFITKTAFSVVTFTFFASIIPSNLDVITINSSGDKLIAAIISALFVGAGTGLLLKIGSSGGGSDVIAVYISVFKGKSFGVYNLMINTVVIFIALLMTQDIIVATLSLINLYIINVVIDSIHNTQEKRLMIIITTQEEEVTAIVSKNMIRGTTVIQSKGGYSKVQNSTLMISISKGEVNQAIALIKEADPKSFINVLKNEKIVGNFENPYQKML